MTERDFVIKVFRESFECKKEQRIVLYGLGKYTKLIIRECRNFNIVAVCGDEKQIQQERMIEGKEIVSLNTVPHISATIVIVANFFNCKKIYQRIRKIEDKGVSIYSIHGELLKDCVNEEKGDCEDVLNDIRENVHTGGDRWFVDNFLDIVVSKFNKKDNKLMIKKPEEFGRCFVAPLVLGFLNSSYRKLEGKGSNSIVWFLARDGYFINKMYEKYRDKSGYKDLPKGEYVLASRRNLSTVAIKSEEDIRETINNGGIVGDAYSYLRDRYELVLNSKQEKGLSKENLVWSFRKNILERAKWERNNYIKYLKQNDLFRENIFVFDLVTTGTAFRYLKGLFPEYDFKLLCFQYLNCNEDFGGDKSFFYLGESNYYSKSSWLTHFAILFEIIFGPPENMFKYIDSNFNPHYEESQREMYINQWYTNIQKIQIGAEKFLDDIYKKKPDIFQSEISADVIDKILKLLLPRYSDLVSDVKENFKIEMSFRGMGWGDAWEKCMDSILEL